MEIAQEDVANGPAAVASPNGASANARKGRVRVIALGVLAAAVLAGGGYYLHARHFEDTDDAQIDGNISNISPRVNGTIKAVYVVENQAVKAGDVLAEIDPSDLEVAVAQAKAQVAQAEAQLKAEDPSVSITESSNEAALATASSDVSSSYAALAAARKEVAQTSAQLAQAEANDKTAQLEKERSARLIAQGAISQADFDNRNNAAMASAAAVDALKQSLAAAKDRVVQQQARIVAAQSKVTEVRSNAPRQVETRRASVLTRQASLDLAKAQLEQAELNLSYAKIIAPVAGIVGKKTVNVGDRVSPGQQLLAIAQTDSLWVTANFRETQLKQMSPGQEATISVDALGLDLHGSVESIGGATGARFSVLPPENATGNYVKVVQRIPVRIRIEPGQSGMDRLRPGMSVEPEVRVR
jgi:membrane fusion protein (multidrug efflux system)